MPYVGNDIVSLNDPAARGKSGNIRFLKRVFTPNERLLIGRSADPDLILWSLWSAKESAFKVACKKDVSVASVPARYEVRVDSSRPLQDRAWMSGWVNTPAGPIFFRTFIGPDFVHCIAADARPSPDIVRWGMERCSAGEESHRARRAAAIGIAEFFGVDPSVVAVRRERADGKLAPPRVYLDGRPMPGDISLSHDFPFVAYAFTAAIGADAPEPAGILPQTALSRS